MFDAYESVMSFFYLFYYILIPQPHFCIFSDSSHFMFKLLNITFPSFFLFDCIFSFILFFIVFLFCLVISYFFLFPYYIEEVVTVYIY